MLRLLIHENLNRRILRGLKLRSPALDYLIVQDTELHGLLIRRYSLGLLAAPNPRHVAYRPRVPGGG